MKATIVVGRPCIMVKGRDDFGEEITTEHMITMEDVARLRMELGDILLHLAPQEGTYAAADEFLNWGVTVRKVAAGEGEE